MLMRDCALRRVRPAATDDAKRFLYSPLRAELEKSGDLVASEIVPVPIVRNDLTGVIVIWIVVLKPFQSSQCRYFLEDSVFGAGN